MLSHRSLPIVLIALPLCLSSAAGQESQRVSQPLNVIGYYADWTAA